MGVFTDLGILKFGVYKGLSKNSGNSSTNKKYLVSTLSIEVGPLGTVGSCAQGDYFEGEGGD
jgi:hypothetical protein